MALVGAALALLLGVCVRLAAANVMGIDLGSEFMKVRACAVLCCAVCHRRPSVRSLVAWVVDRSIDTARSILFPPQIDQVSLVKPGSMMDIVTNIHSKRKTETMVSFYQGERSYGADAYSLLTRKPEVTYARVPTLLGRHEEHPAVALLEGAYFPTKVGYNETRGGLAIEHSAPATDEMPPVRALRAVLTCCAEALDCWVDCVNISRRLEQRATDPAPHSSAHPTPKPRPQLPLPYIRRSPPRSWWP